MKREKGKEIKRRRKGRCRREEGEGRRGGSKEVDGEELEYRSTNREGLRKRVVKRRRKGQRIIRVGTGGLAGGRRKSVKSGRGVKKGGEEEGKRREGRKGKKKGLDRTKRPILEGSIGEEKGKQGEEEVVVVTEAWVSGRLTNNRGRSEYVKRKKARGMENRRERGREGKEKGGKGYLEGTHSKKGETKEHRWYEKNRKGREPWLGGKGKRRRPGVIVFRNPEEHEVGRREAQRCGIPTAGRCGPRRGKEKEARRTYGRPWKREKPEKGRLRRGRRREKALTMKRKGK